MTRSPFPGMDPYLEPPALHPDIHNTLVVKIADAVTPLIAPRYYTETKRRTYLLEWDNDVLGARLDKDRNKQDEVGESYLEIHESSTRNLVTIVEILSPLTKIDPQGRAEYEIRRANLLQSHINFVEIDLLRAGEPRQIVGPTVDSDYRILVSRGAKRPRAQLYPFGLRHTIPAFPLPLLPNDEEPTVELGEILHALYTRARFDLRLNYTKPPVPPLQDEDVSWAQTLIAQQRDTI